MAESMKRMELDGVAVPLEATTGQGQAVARDPLHEGERWVAHVLRAGAVGAGALFLSSSLLAAFSDAPLALGLTHFCRKAGVVVLLGTPVLRLVSSGVLLGANGEWRFTLYALGVLALLGLSMGTGLGHL